MGDNTKGINGMQKNRRELTIHNEIVKEGLAGMEGNYKGGEELIIKIGLVESFEEFIASIHPESL